MTHFRLLTTFVDQIDPVKVEFLSTLAFEMSNLIEFIHGIRIQPKSTIEFDVCNSHEFVRDYWTYVSYFSIKIHFKSIFKHP